MHLQLVAYVVVSLLAVRTLFLLYRNFTSPLRHIPGPFVARFTRAWYFIRVWTGYFERDNIQLHEKYSSKVVRVAPNWYSITGTDAIKKVYAPGSQCAKSNWYDGWKHPDPDQFTLFPDKNIKRHGETKKLFSALYSMSSLLSYEPFVDQCVDLFAERLLELSKKNEEIDLGYWLQCYAFDVIGCITYGERFGFLDKGEDIQGAIKAVGSIAAYSTLAGIYSEWHPFCFKILGLLGGSGAAGRNYVRQFAREIIAKHKQSKKQQTNGDNSPRKQEPFLMKMIRSQQENPGKVTDYHLFMMAQSNVIAGFDTTAISLSFTLYYLIKYPRVLQKLRDEIDAATKAGTCRSHIAFQQSRELPYFQAVLKEALRMHAATGLPLWRVIPEGGLEIEGQYFPQGTTVGMNSWVAHYDEDVFTHANEFRPERWIDSDPAKLKAMNDMYMPFGLGSRTCLGKHISILEMSKLVPILVRDFDFKLTTPDQDLKTANFWFVKPLDFPVRVSRRGN